MKYLFFDVECSNCFNGIGKICEFGYVLTDDKLNVIKCDDIPMSPGHGKGNRFHLKGRKDQKDLELAYDYEYYFTCPEFPKYYPLIKKFMEDKETMCFAYSMDNDIAHLHHTCLRYKLEPLNYECCDVQKLVAAYLEKKGQMSLHTACKTIVGPHSCVKLQEHLSKDDAEMERLILEAICTLTQKDSKTILDESQFARTNSLVLMDKLSHKEKKKRIKTQGHELYNSIAVDESELDKAEYAGRRYNISRELKVDLELLKKTIDLVQHNNGILCNKISKSDFFITYDEKNKEEIIKGFKHPFEGKVLTYQEFVDLMVK